ncbi:MAG: TolC family protein [Bacteroidota bacterium]|nr:TolC family protein [Bacteroidota bacterium]
MKRFFRIFIITITVPALVAAQEAAPVSGKLTLEECIQYALKNSVNIKNAVIDEEIADARVKETRGIGLPQIDATVGVLHNQKLPRFFAQYFTPVEGQESFFDLSGVPGIEDGDVVGLPNFFQLRSSGNATLSITQILFNGSYLVGLKAASAYRELSIRSTRQSREQLVQQVTKAYYAVLINKDRMKLFDNNIARVDSLLKTTQALNKNGFAEGIDVDRIQVTLNNLIAERDKFYNLQELAVHLLKFQMNYPMGQPIDVAGDIADLQVDESLLQQYELNWDYTKRSDYALLEANRNLQQLDVRNKFSTALPSLSAFANLGYSTQSPNIGGIFRTETKGVNDTPEYGPDKWYSSTSFGLNLNIPIFSGLQRSYRLQQAKLNLMKVENSFTSLKSAIDLEIKQAAISYLNAIKSLESQRANTALAENIARVTKIKYEEGVGSNLEVIDAEAALKEAQTNYYNALYDALIAKVDLDKAYGKLMPPTETESK